MSIVNKFKDILKPGEEAKKPVTAKKTASRAKKSKAVTQEVAVRKETTKKSGSAKNPEAYKIVKYPVIAEKATGLTMLNKYVFRLEPAVTKSEVKKAIESIYGVKVAGVNIVNVPRKKRRRGRVMGWRSGFKKAIVTLREGEKLDIVPS